MSDAATATADTTATTTADTGKPANTATASVVTDTGDKGKGAATVDPKNQVTADWRAEFYDPLPDDATEEEREAHDKLVRQLARLPDKKAIAKKLRAQEVIISSTRQMTPKPDGKDEKAMAAWRKEQGLPEAPDKYEIKLDNGQVLGDADKPFVDMYLKAMHESDASPELVNKGIKSYLAIQEAQLQQRQEKDLADKETMEDTLLAEWGQADYRANVNGIKGLLLEAGKDVSEGLINARLPDGTGLMNHPGVLKWLAGHARKWGYVGATITPAGSGDFGKALADEIKSLESSMYKENGERNPEYWKDDKKQARYRELLEAKERRG